METAGLVRTNISAGGRFDACLAPSQTTKAESNSIKG